MSARFCRGVADGADYKAKLFRVVSQNCTLQISGKILLRQRAPSRLCDPHPRDLDRAPTRNDLVPFLHDQPPALFVAEIKFRHGSGFGRLLIRRVNGPEILPALPDDRDAPSSELGSGAVLSHALS